MSDSDRYLSDALNRIRNLLREKSLDDMSVLLKISFLLRNLDTNRMNAEHAASWTIQDKSEKEIDKQKRVEDFAKELGYGRGFKHGLLIGFAVCAVIVLIIKLTHT
jgi:hypothetical protein